MNKGDCGEFYLANILYVDFLKKRLFRLRRMRRYNQVLLCMAESEEWQRYLLATQVYATELDDMYIIR